MIRLTLVSILFLSSSAFGFDVGGAVMNSQINAVIQQTTQQQQNLLQQQNQQQSTTTTTTGTASTTATGTATATSSGNRVTTTQLPVPQRSTGSMIPQSNEAQQQNSGGMNLGMIGTIAGTAVTIGASCCCYYTMQVPVFGTVTCQQAAIIGALATAASSLLSSDHASAGAGAQNASLAVTNPTAPPVTPETWMQQNSPLTPEYVAALNRLKQYGYKVDEKTGVITTPDGKKIGPNTVNDPAALAALGIDPSTMKDYMGQMGKSAMAKLKDMDLKSSKGADTDAQFGEGLGAGGGGGAGGSGFSMDMGAGKDGKKDAKRGPADTAGLAKRLAGGGLIGRAEDNLFTMMNRRFVVEDTKIPFELAPAAANQKK